MRENFEDQKPEGLDVQKYLGIARRRHLHFLLPLLFGWLAVWGASWALPARYKSGTLILVEHPSMPKDYVPPNINDDLQERLQTITQQILSRTRLEHIIEALGLYPAERSRRTPDELVESMRKDISIELVRDTQSHVNAFNVYYSAADPHVAQRVTSELTNLFINENLEVRQQQSEGTTKFLEDQLATAGQALAEQEKRVRDFKGQHMGELPTQLASNLQILGGLQSQLQTEEDALNTAKQQRVYLETMAGQYQALQGPRGTETPTELSSLEQEIQRLKAQSADLSSRYTERHPDVRKLKDLIARKEKMRDQILAGLKDKTNTAQPDGVEAMANAADPTQASSPIGQLKGQLQVNQLEIKNREQAIAGLKSKISEYQARLNQEPVREQQLADLTRDYNQSKANYDELLKKKNDSAMATRMELLQQGERFRVLDPPNLPVKPDFPNRLRFCGIGVVVGLLLGSALVAGFEMKDDRVYDEEELKTLLPIVVITEIPPITNSIDERRYRRRMWLGWGTATLVFTAILAGSAVSFLHG